MSEHILAAKTQSDIERRNHELLQFQDAALALRLCGNVPDAEDILQDAFIKAVNVSEPLVTGNDLRNWFLHVTANVARDRFRSEQRRRTRERSAATDATTANAVDVVPGDTEADVRKRINAELSQLDEKLRAPIALHYEQGLSYEEAAFVLGVPAPTLRVYASRGIEELRQRLATAGKPMIAEVVIGALATGFAIKTSPALAASISSIVNGNAGAIAADSVAKPLHIPQATAGMSTFVKAAIIAVLCGAALAITFAAGYWTGWNKDSSGTAQSPDNVIASNDVQATEQAVTPFEAPLQKLEAAAPKAEDAEPVPVDWAGAVNLLPMIDPARDAVVGNWHFEGASLIGEPERYGRIMAPYEVPREYDLRVEFTRRIGEVHPQIGAPTVTFLISHKNRNYIFRIDTLTPEMGFYSDFVKLPQHPDAKPTPMLVNGVRYTCTIFVREESLQAYLDGALLRSVNLAKTPISEAPPDWKLRDSRCVGFGSHGAQVQFHSVTLRPVSGQGNAVAADPDAQRIHLEEHWKDALDLIAQPLSQENAIGGKWTLGDGPVSVQNLPEPRDVCPRIQFNVTPPEEYDFRIEFTRDAGRFDVAQILSAYGRSFVWKMGIDGGLCLLDRVGGVAIRPMQNPRAVRVPEIKPGERHISVVCIRRDHVSCFLDGRLIATLKTNYSDLDIEQNWKLRSPQAIGVGVAEANATFHKAQLKVVTGTITPLSVKTADKPAR